MTSSINPFRVSRLESLRFRFSKGDFSSFIARLKLVGLRGAIVGPHGSGKTTLLEELYQHFSLVEGSVCLIRLNTETRTLSSEALAQVRRNEIILLDGAEQFSTYRWRLFLRKIRPTQNLIITSHKEGRLPTIYQCSTNAALLADLTYTLSPHFRGSTELFRQLFERHHGNLRHALFELYDTWSKQGEAQEGMQNLVV